MLQMTKLRAQRPKPKTGSLGLHQRVIISESWLSQGDDVVPSQGAGRGGCVGDGTKRFPQRCSYTWESKVKTLKGLK